MEDPTKISVEDALRLQNINLKKLLIETEEKLFFANLRTTYNLQPRDEFNPETLEIVRKSDAQVVKEDKVK